MIRRFCAIVMVLSMFLMAGCWYKEKDPETAMLEETREFLSEFPPADPDKLIVEDVFPYEDVAKIEEHNQEAEDMYLRHDIFFHSFLPKYPDESNAAVRVWRYPVKFEYNGYTFPEEIEMIYLYAHFYPKFDDLKSPGADEIRRHYLVEYEKAAEEAKEAYSLSGVLEYNLNYDHGISSKYSFLDWDSWVVGNYLVVSFLSALDTDYGSHHNYWTDHFDLTTGKLLTPEDIFGDTEAAAQTLIPVVTKRLAEEYEKRYDLSTHQEIANELRSRMDYRNFRLEQDGIMFFFDSELFDGEQYEYQYHKNYQTLVPYDELKDTLKISVK